jgi:D-glycero-alpha-D-manno-heptose-7-phosphate kinase
MIIIKTPFRISFFGGSTDYKSFYEEYGSFIIGATIDKYVWLSARFRPKILPKHHSIAYSKLETATSVDDIQNPLIREVLKHHKIKEHIDFHSAADIPARSGGF